MPVVRSHHKQSGGTEALLRERASIANSEREIDSILGQAFSISNTLAAQRRTFGALSPPHLLLPPIPCCCCCCLPVFCPGLAPPAPSRRRQPLSSGTHICAGSIGERMKALGERIPMVNNLMKQIQARTQRDKYIMSLTVGLCFCFLVWWTFL